MKTKSANRRYFAQTAILLMMLLASVTAGAQNTYISDVMVIGGTQDKVNELKESYKAEGWTVIDQDLNAGCGSGTDYIYLLYKSGSSASPNHTFVTGFYISNASGDAPESLDHKGYHYTLVPYDGDDYFKKKRGDLNSHAGGDYIHLYFTKEKNEAVEAVSQITFNKTQSGAIGKNGGGNGYDLNEDAGGDYIYMHCEYKTAPNWKIQKSSDGSSCIVKGFTSSAKGEGATYKDILAFPAIIEGAAVVRIDSVNFSDFSELETIYFSEAYNANSIPSTFKSYGASFCGSLMHIHIVDNSGTVVKYDELPASVTSIPNEAFFFSAIEKLTMPNVLSVPMQTFGNCIALESVTIPKVTSIGNFAFAGCNSLKSITTTSSLTNIGECAFSACTSLISITLPSSVMTIGNEAFKGCENLASATINANPTMGKEAFPDATTLVLKPRTNKGDGASWTTFYNDRYDFKAQGVAKVFKATVTGGKVVLTEVKDKIVKAGTAVVLKTGENNSWVQLNRTTDTGTDTQRNDLHGVNADTFIDSLTVSYPDRTFYLLSTDGTGFYRFRGDMMPQNEAFIALPPGAVTPEMMPLVEAETLTDNSSNSVTLANWAGDNKTRNVMLVGRTLWKDGYWNTLCLPFALTAEQVTAQLNPAKLMTLSTSSFSGGTLTLNFEDATTIDAGKPYIVKWTAGDANIENPVFIGVIVSNATASVETDYVDFIGTYDPTNIYTTEKTNLYLGDGNKLYYPWGDDMTSFTINAFRGYFQLNNGLVCGNPSQGGDGINAFVLNFGEETGLTPIPSPKGEGSDLWYAIDGRKLSGKPAQKGIYINNGKKVVIK